MRAIICGGGVADGADPDLIAALDALHARSRITLVGLRAAPGEDAPGDTLAATWAEAHGIDRVVFPATPARGAYADHDRNHLMLTVLRPGAVILLPGGPDTTNLAAQAAAARIKVHALEARADGGETSSAAEPQGPSSTPTASAPPAGRGRPGAPRPSRAARA